MHFNVQIVHISSRSLPTAGRVRANKPRQQGFTNDHSVAILAQISVSSMLSQRTKGIGVDGSLIKELLDRHAPLKHVHNKTLFACRGCKWKTMQSYRQFLSDLIDLTQGRVPHQLSLQIQLSTWLHDQGQDWSRDEVDKCIKSLRELLQLLLSKKRNDTQVPKNKHAELQALAD